MKYVKITQKMVINNVEWNNNKMIDLDNNRYSLAFIFDLKLMMS